MQREGIQSRWIEQAGEWLLDSGIQTTSGGVARYYVVDQRRDLPVSNEITGYAISALSWLHGWTGDGRYREAAAKAARFLVREAWRPALRTFPFENGDPLRAAYFFDCGVVVRGLLAASRLTGEPEFRSIAEEAGRSMANDFLTPEGIHPIVELPSKQPLPYEPRWSREPGCYQLKAALAWHELAALGDETFAKHYEQALAQALAGWRGFLPGAEGNGVVDRLHAFGYFLEGLLPAAGRPEVRIALVDGIDAMAYWLRERQAEFERSDVYAQLLRVRLWAESLWDVPLDHAAGVQEAEAIAGFQQASNDRRVDGGFCFGRRAGNLLPYANPVSTAFCVQALAMWEARQAGEAMPDLRELI